MSVCTNKPEQPLTRVLWGLFDCLSWSWLRLWLGHAVVTSAKLTQTCPHSMLTRARWQLIWMERLLGACCSVCIILFTIKPTLHVKEPRHREIKSFPQEHAISRQQSWSLDACLCDFQTCKMKHDPSHLAAVRLVFQKPPGAIPEA